MNHDEFKQLLEWHNSQAFQLGIRWANAEDTTTVGEMREGLDISGPKALIAAFDEANRNTEAVARVREMCEQRGALGLPNPMLEVADVLRAIDGGEVKAAELLACGGVTYFAAVEEIKKHEDYRVVRFECVAGDLGDCGWTYDSSQFGVCLDETSGIHIEHLEFSQAKAREVKL